ncbi:MAG TPA: RNA pseudouridine synthase [Chthoniobacteraceae bacterium]|nr:RNA pseudouridine synthase [Chthoniobacteraceae bacterium]
MFEIIEEHAEWIVVNKAAGVMAHPKKPGGPVTLWDGLRGLLAYEVANGGQVSLINRLDRETSGLVLVAKTLEAARRFHQAMEERQVAKEYMAITWGWPEEDEFEVDAPIVRQGERLPCEIYLKRCVHPGGAPATTRFRVEQRFEKPGLSSDGRFSLLRAFPRTGRTHQIRVHLAHAGFPIVGDKLYGPSERCYLEFIETGWTPALASRLLLPRHALHSARMTVSPRGETVVYDWRAPLAADLAAWLPRPAV